VDVSHDVVITELDCGTENGLEVGPLIESGEVIQPIGDRILGRTVLADVVDPVSGEMIVAAGSEVDEAAIVRIEAAGIEKVLIRSPLTCESRRGICVKCYGRDLARGATVSLGEAVGIIAAQSIGEPGTQLTMRTFHLGGAASKAVEQSIYTARFDGQVKFFNIQGVNNKSNRITILNRNGEIPNSIWCDLKCERWRSGEKR
jgi:DNA-directed RNA polymerase subunit beta'